jgi:ABC-type microcin C transport system permease subunit YejB
LSAFEKPQRDALAMLFLRLHHQGVIANEIFWGLWLFPLALLVIKSGFLPRFLGAWLIINGFAYLITSFTGLLLPQYESTVSNITFPALLGELAFMLWILIKGIRQQPLAAAAA